MTMTIRPWQVAGVLFLILICAVGLNVALLLVFGPDGVRHHASMAMFDFRVDGNVPNYFSALVLLCAAIACVVNACVYSGSATKHGLRALLPGWRVLALVFAYLSVDEAAQFHEQLSRFHVAFSGNLTFADQRSWVFYYVPFALLIGLACLPFLFRMPRRSAVLIVLSGIVYVAGKAGLELLGAWQIFADHLTKSDLSVALRAVTEESTEVLGLILFIGAALEHAARANTAIVLRLVGRQVPVSAAPPIPSIAGEAELQSATRSPG